MNQLKKEEMICVKGGASFSSSLLNAMMRTISVMFSIGQAVGSALRRATTGRYC